MNLMDTALGGTFRNMVCPAVGHFHAWCSESHVPCGQGLDAVASISSISLLIGFIIGVFFHASVSFLLMGRHLSSIEASDESSTGGRQKDDGSTHRDDASTLRQEPEPRANDRKVEFCESCGNGSNAQRTINDPSAPEHSPAWLALEAARIRGSGSPPSRSQSPKSRGEQFAVSMRKLRILSGTNHGLIEAKGRDLLIFSIDSSLRSLLGWPDDWEKQLPTTETGDIASNPPSTIHDLLPASTRRAHRGFFEQVREAEISGREERGASQKANE